MHNVFGRSIVRRLGSLLLALAMVLSFFAAFNVQPGKAAAADGTDIAVTGLYVEKNQVRVSLYDVANTTPTSTQIALYRNGVRIYQNDSNLSWTDRTARLNISLKEECTNCDLTVTIQTAGDVDRSNDNLSVTIGTSSTFPTETTEDTTPTQPTKPTEPTPPETSAPTVPPETSAPTVPPETSAPTVPPETSAPTEPPKVKSVKVTAEAKETTVTLTWSLNDDGDVNPEKYEITLGDKIYTANKPGSWTVENLTPGTEYSYTVKAYFMNEVKSTVKNTVTTNSFTPTGDGWDLTVTSVTWTPKNPKVGDNVVFSATIQNVGGSSTPSNKKHGLKFTIDNNSYVWNDQFYGSLQPGESKTLTASGGPNNTNAWAAVLGSHTVTALVNDDQTTGDEKRENNSLSAQFTVSNVSLVQVPTGGMGDADNVNVATPGCYGGRENNQVSVVINGKPSPSINAKVNSSRVWNVARVETVPVNIFELKEGKSATVRIGLPDNVDLQSAVVRPLSAKITPTIVSMENGQRYIEFTVKEQGSYVVEYNGQTEGAIHLFANPDYSNGGYNGTYLPLGHVRVNDGTYGLNGTVYGSGVLVKSEGTRNMAATKAGSGARIYGITLINENVGGFETGGVWNVEIASSNDVEFDYFHIMACGANSDGISIQSSSKIRIDHSFFRTWDDGVVVKNYYSSNSNDVTVQNCVFWTDLAQSMEIGAETNKEWNGATNYDPQIHDVRFTDIDVIHACHKPAISIHNMDNAKVYNITWENITIEDASMGDNASGEDGWPILIDLTTVKGGEMAGTAGGWSNTGRRTLPGTISNVTLKNIRVLSWKNSNNVTPGIRLARSGEVNGDSISGIKVQGLYYRQDNGSTLKIDGNNVSTLCGWNPVDDTDPKYTAKKVDYNGVITFESAVDVTLPNPNGTQAQSAGGVAARVATLAGSVLEAARVARDRASA